LFPYGFRRKVITGKKIIHPGSGEKIYPGSGSRIQGVKKQTGSGTLHLKKNQFIAIVSFNILNRFREKKLLQITFLKIPISLAPFKDSPIYTVPVHMVGVPASVKDC
jgi:hypothetical protein